MVYFKSEMNTADVIQLIKQVDIKVFCLWQEKRSIELFGMVKNSAYEYFLVACSLLAVQKMSFLTLAQLTHKVRQVDMRVICGNEQLTE